MKSHPKFNGRFIFTLKTLAVKRAHPFQSPEKIFVKGRDNPYLCSSEFMSECNIRNTEHLAALPSPDTSGGKLWPMASADSVWICRLCRRGGLSIKRRTERRCGEASGQ